MGGAHGCAGKSLGLQYLQEGFWACQAGLGAEDSMGHIRKSLGLSKGAWA